MPRPGKKRASSMELRPGQAAYVLERLVRERRVSGADVRRCIADMGREIADLEARLYRLRQASGNGAPTSPAGSGPVGSERRPRRSAATQPARARTHHTKKVAARPAKKNTAKQLGGRFAGLIRRLPQADRAQYHEIKQRDGVEAAIKALQNRR
jgi:hypothetical protein